MCIWFSIAIFYLTKLGLLQLSTNRIRLWYQPLMPCLFKWLYILLIPNCMCNLQQKLLSVAGCMPSIVLSSSQYHRKHWKRNMWMQINLCLKAKELEWYLDRHLVWLPDHNLLSRTWVRISENNQWIIKRIIS